MADKPHELAPMPVDGVGGMKPLATMDVAVPTPKIADVDLGDVVDNWVDAHPEKPAPAEPLGEKPAVAEPEKKPVEAEAKPPPPPTPAPETKPVVEGEAKPTVEGQPKPAEPPKPEPRTYAKDEKFTLAANPDGSAVEWTREQIVKGLQERAAAQPLAAEATEFKRIFGMDAAEAKTQWEPVLERLQAEPQTAQFLATYLQADPAKAAYLERSAAYFDEARSRGEVPAPEAKPAPAGEIADPVLRQEIARMRQYFEGQQQRDAEARLNREIASATSEYTFLGSDRNMLGALVGLASMMWKEDEARGVPEDQRRGLPHAIAAQKPLLDLERVRREAVDAANPGAPQPEVPPLLGTGGGSPNPAQRPSENRPRKYANLEDAVDHWMDNPPAKFRT